MTNGHFDTLPKLTLEKGRISGRSCKAKRIFPVIEISYPQFGKAGVEKKICVQLLLKELTVFTGIVPLLCGACTSQTLARLLPFILRLVLVGIALSFTNSKPYSKSLNSYCYKLPIYQRLHYFSISTNIT